MSNRWVFVALIALASCGRPADDADVKFVGVVGDPDEIGPAPTAWGGVVEYDYVDMAGGGLNLGLMGLSGTEAIGPDMGDFEPPYEGVFGFSYVFDQQLTAADTLVQIGGSPPDQLDSCYTAFDPQGPIGSFTTVDVGDFMSFQADDPAYGFRMGRFPTDYPPDPQGMFIYYIGFQYYTPSPLTHLVPNPDAPADPTAMLDRVYRKGNFPFGAEMQFSFPGGFARFDQPVASIPRPHRDTAVRLPSELGGIVLEWDGPRYDVEGAVLDEGLQTRCFEFFEGRESEAPPTTTDCAELALPGNGIEEYRDFDGQVYTAPWDTSDGKVVFRWDPTAQDGDDIVSLTVRFMAPIDPTDPGFSFEAVELPNGGYRPAQACDDDRVFPFDEDAFQLADGNFRPAAQGDPFSQMINVTCRLEDDGEFELTRDRFAQALRHADSNEVGGVVFFFSRGTEVAAEVPPAKDKYDQRHDISPIKVTANAVRIGRFWWDGE